MSFQTELRPPIDRVAAIHGRVLSRMRTPVVLSGKKLLPEEAAAPDGLLPVFMMEACTIWETLSGNPVAAQYTPDPEALLGVRVVDAPALPIAVTLACLCETAHSVLRPEAILTDALLARWANRLEEIRLTPVPVPSIADE